MILRILSVFLIKVDLWALEGLAIVNIILQIRKLGKSNIILPKWKLSLPQQLLQVRTPTKESVRTNGAKDVVVPADHVSSTDSLTKKVVARQGTLIQCSDFTHTSHPIQPQRPFRRDDGRSHGCVSECTVSSKSACERLGKSYCECSYTSCLIYTFILRQPWHCTFGGPCHTYAAVNAGSTSFGQKTQGRKVEVESDLGSS